MNEARREYVRQWRAKNMERIRVLARKNHEKNKERDAANRAAWLAEHKEQVAASASKHYFQNREAILQKREQKRLENPERHHLLAAARTRKYRQVSPSKYRKSLLRFRIRHPEQIALWATTGRVKRNALKNGCRIGDEDQIRDFYRKTLKANSILCEYCGNPCGKACLTKANVDHKIPLSKGGDHDVSNLAVACSCCNGKKYNRTVEEFAIYLKELQDVNKEIAS